MFTKKRAFQHRKEIKSMYWWCLEKTRSLIVQNVGLDPQGTTSQTKCFGKETQLVGITYKHHPLFGSKLQLFSVEKAKLTLVLPDSSRCKIPRHWTDFDGEEKGVQTTFESYFTVKAVRELIQKVQFMKERKI